MTIPTRLLLNAYYWTSLPRRRRAARVRAAQKTEPVCILFYHRIADCHPNAWTMSTRRFERQVNWLRRRFDVVSLADAQARIASGANDRPTACITFDDGYAENMHFAVPLLSRHKLPFTYFVSTSYVLGGQLFPHDVERGQPLAPNTPEDLRSLAAEGVEIGAHTRSHPNLGLKLAPAQLEDEIAGSKRDLEHLLEQNVRYFAFPYGHPANMSPEAFRVAYESGFAGICSAYGSYNIPGDDPFHLRRFHADPEMIRFQNWLTVDPRKLRQQCHFSAGDFRQCTTSSNRKEPLLETAADA